MKRREFFPVFALVATMFAWSFSVHADEKMTPAQFREIASSPGDSTPLDPKLLAVGPVWTKGTATIVSKFADGRTVRDDCAGTARTVKGKYVVSTINSATHKQPIDSIVAYDEKSGCYKFWGLYGDTVTEGLMVYDLDKKIFSSYSTNSDGFLELGVNSYSDTNYCGHTLILKNGVLFCTRDVTVVRAEPAAR